MERLAPLLANADFTFEFKEPQNLPNPMLSIDNASFGYPPPADAPPGTPPTVIVRGVSESVFAGQRIGILGANGQGKSTVVKTIARTLPVIEGEVLEGRGLNIGYFAQQELDVLRPADTPLEHMIRLARDTIANGGAGQFSSREQDLRSFLGTFNFSGDMVKQAVGTMSGGEKARLVLCMIVWQRPNLLLLDEPTNHLDLATREALAMALNEFEGTVMLVSHDRALLRSVCDEFWMVSTGGVEPFDGDLDDYQRYLLDESKRLRESLKEAGKTAEPVKAAPSPVPAKRVVSSGKIKPLKQSLEKLDKSLGALQTEKAALEARLAGTLSVEEITETGRQLQQVNDELEREEGKWLELSEQIETLEAAGT
jgi:ATP-binding cassette subfamily F protein 3